MNTRLLIWVLLFCITIPLIFPFLQAGYLQTDDGIWAIVRQAEMHRELKDGQFPARWSAYLNHGYGYPLFLFTYPLPYYLGEIIHLIGFNAIDAVKILFIASTVLSALTMFYFVTSLWGEWAGLVATTLYLYVPYRLLNLFVRGSVGELLASIFYPLLFYLFWQLLLKPSYKKVLGSASVLAALILTHNASIILFAPFLAGWIGYWLFKVKNKPPASKAIVLSVLFALGLSATFWLPALVEKQFIALSITPLAQKADHFLSFSVLLGQTLHPLTQTALSLGNFQILLSLGALILGVRSVKGQSLGLRLFLTLAIIITLFMVLPVSVTFWKLPLFKELDFPWRTLGVATFLFSVLGSGIVVSKFGQFMVIPIIIVTVFLSLGSIKLSPRLTNPSQYYETNDDTTTSSNELLPIWVDQKPIQRPSQIAVLDIAGRVTMLKHTSTHINLEVETNSAGLLTVNTLYFPGWKAAIDKRTVPVAVTPLTGLISLSTPRGIHLVTLQFVRTPVRLVADMISTVVLLVGAGLWWYSKRLPRF